MVDMVADPYVVGGYASITGTTMHDRQIDHLQVR